MSPTGTSAVMGTSDGERDIGHRRQGRVDSKLDAGERYDTQGSKRRGKKHKDNFEGSKSHPDQKGRAWVLKKKQLRRDRGREQAQRRRHRGHRGPNHGRQRGGHRTTPCTMTW